MHPKFLFDENISQILWEAVQTYNRFAVIPMEVIRVGEGVDLPKGASDPEVLLWAEANGCILVSHDKKTLPDHLANHLATGRHLPGLFLLSYFNSAEEIVELLGVAAQSENPNEWQDLIEYLG